MLFQDIHRHTLYPVSGSQTIVNLTDNYNRRDHSGWYSVGMHPWYLKEENAEREFAELKSCLPDKQVLAVGECGLDKVCMTDFLLQQKWLERQLILAQQWKKPVIIHCVKAYEEVFSLLKKNLVTVPVIFHGFNKKAALAQRIVGEGYFISFGKFLLDDRSKEIIRIIPPDRLFFETDMAEINIKTIYDQAAKALKMDLSLLCKQITQNATLVFGKEFTRYE